MSKIFSPPLQMESWARCLRGRHFLFVLEEIVYSFRFLFDIFWNSVYLTYVPLKESLTLFQIWIIFYYTFTYFVPIGLIGNRVTKIKSRYFNGKLWLFRVPWLFNSIFIYSSSYGLAFEKFIFELQPLTKYLRLTLVSMWSNALRQKFNFCFSTVFC